MTKTLRNEKWGERYLWERKGTENLCPIYLLNLQPSQEEPSSQSQGNETFPSSTASSLQYLHYFLSLLKV